MSLQGVGMPNVAITPMSAWRAIIQISWAMLVMCTTHMYGGGFIGIHPHTLLNPNSLQCISVLSLLSVLSVPSLKRECCDICAIRWCHFLTFLWSHHSYQPFPPPDLTLSFSGLTYIFSKTRNPKTCFNFLRERTKSCVECEGHLCVYISSMVVTQTVIPPHTLHFITWHLITCSCTRPCFKVEELTIKY